MPVTSAVFVRGTIALLLVGLIAVIGIVAASLWLAGQTDEHADSLVRQQEIRRDAFRILQLAQDMETGQRGYLLTLDERYLDPYRDARARIATAEAKLRELAGDTPAYAQSAATLSGLIAEKLAELDSTVELARSGEAVEAVEVVRTNRGKAVMDAIRDTTNGFIAAVDEQVSSSAAEMQSSARALTWVLVLGGIVIVAVVVGSALIAWRYTRELVAARLELEGLNAGLEERVRERTSDLARANEEIQRFAYIVSHDLRSPLVNVMGFTSELETSLSAIRAYTEQIPPNTEDKAALEARSAAVEDMPESITFIRSATAKMDNLINAILKLSREGRRRLTSERVDMSELLEAAANTVRHQIGENGGEIAVEGPIPDINSDRLALEQIFGNLVDNAVKYLDDSRPGRIVIRGRETSFGREYEVEDNGRGIAPEDRERVFELFRRAGAQDRRGEGIGLTHVRALARRLGGDITLESRVGAGTTFRLRLPRSLPLLREAA